LETAVTLDKARELIQVQLGFGGGYNRNAVRLILGEVQRPAVNQLIRELVLEQAFGLAIDTDFSKVGISR
jgi:hypothetical protein